MFATRELTELEARKAVLLAESEIKRQELLGDVARLRPVVSSVELGVGLVKRLQGPLSLAAPLLGIWAARKKSRRPGLWTKVAFAARLFWALKTAWKSVKSSAR